MSTELTALRYMGTQSEETVLLGPTRAAHKAAAAEPLGSSVDRVNNALEAAAREVSQPASGASSVPASYHMQDEFFKTMLIAASAGALLMGLAALMARSSSHKGDARPRRMR